MTRAKRSNSKAERAQVDSSRCGQMGKGVSEVGFEKRIEFQLLTIEEEGPSWKSNKVDGGQNQARIKLVNGIVVSNWVQPEADCGAA